jgi:hypothetical protein
MGNRFIKRFSGGASIKDKEKELDNLELDEAIETRETRIAQLKAAKAELKKKYGHNWSKLLKVKANTQRIEDLYAVDPGLRELCVPRRRG